MRAAHVYVKKVSFFAGSKDQGLMKPPPVVASQVEGANIYGSWSLYESYLQDSLLRILLSTFF